MFTLRDLWIFLNPEYRRKMEEEQKYRELFASKMKPQPELGGLSGLLYKKQNLMNESPAMDQNTMGPPSLEWYFRGMEEGANRLKQPYQYKGML